MTYGMYVDWGFWALGATANKDSTYWEIIIMLGPLHFVISYDKK